MAALAIPFFIAIELRFPEPFAAQDPVPFL